MKKIIILTLMLLAITVSLVTQAAVRHPFLEKRQEKELENQAKDIPIYFENTPDRELKVLRDISAHGVFTKNREKIYNELKVKVLKLGGDAVVNVYCKNFKSLNLSCYGTVVRWE